MVAQRIEDDPRVAAAHVQDVRPDGQRVVQPDRLLEEVRQRQERHDPVLHPRDDPVERLDRGDDVVVGEHHALRRAGRAGGEDELEQVGRDGGRPGRDLGLPVGRHVGAGLGRDRVDRRGREAVEPRLARIGRIATGPDDEVSRAGGLDDALDRVGRHPQVERDEDQPRAHRPEVRRGQVRRGRRPGQEAIARLEPQGAQPPGREPRAPVELPIAPRGGGAVVETEAQRGPVAVHGHGLGEQLEQGGWHGSKGSVPRSSNV